ncbi:hypothetical protein N9W34_02615 [Rickettsiales bacterium]|nr:hypothetical protein [Rickettsiales bacterium]
MRAVTIISYIIMSFIFIQTAEAEDKRILIKESQTSPNALRTIKAKAEQDGKEANPYAHPEDGKIQQPGSQNSSEEFSNKVKSKQQANALDVYMACRNYFNQTFNTRENIARKSMCNGFFFGVGSTLLLLYPKGKDDLCLPENMSTEHVIRSFLEWATKQTFFQLRNTFSTKGVIDSLKRADPCSYIDK